MNAQVKQMKTVYTVVERAPGKSFWTKVGVGFVNHDGSINLRLDAIPISGTLQVRDWEGPRDWEKRADGDSPGQGRGGRPQGGEKPRTIARDVMPDSLV